MRVTCSSHSVSLKDGTAPQFFLPPELIGNPQPSGRTRVASQGPGAAPGGRRRGLTGIHVYTGDSQEPGALPATWEMLNVYFLNEQGQIQKCCGPCEGYLV